MKLGDGGVQRQERDRSIYYNNIYILGRDSKEKTAILVAGGTNATKYWPVTDAGYGKGSYDTTTSVELLLLDPKTGKVSQSCILPDMPEKRYSPTVGGNIVCGGYDLDNKKTLNTCRSLTKGQWIETKLISARSSATLWKICDGSVILFGGGSNAVELVDTKKRTTKNLFNVNDYFK